MAATTDERSHLRHSIRGCLNALRLGTTALGPALTRDEQVEFLEYIALATDKMVGLMDQLDEYYERHPAGAEAAVH